MRSQHKDDRLLFLMIIVASCATGCATSAPTIYSPADSQGYGYSIKPDEGVLIANFTGNKDTEVTHAYAYSILAAFDECAKKNQYAMVSKAVNQTKEINYTQVFHETYYDPTPRGHYVPRNYTNTKQKTEVYPSFAEAFECRYSLRQLAGIPRTENISNSLVAQFTKDDKGGVGLAFEKAGFPEGVQDDDLVISLDGKRVGDSVDFYKAIDGAKVGTVQVNVIRNNMPMIVHSRIVDSTDDLRDVEKQTVDLMCDTLGVDEMADIPGAAKSDTEKAHKSAQQTNEYNSAKTLCVKLRVFARAKLKPIELPPDHVTKIRH